MLCSVWLTQLSQTALGSSDWCGNTRNFINPQGQIQRDCWGATASRKVPTNTVVIQPHAHLLCFDVIRKRQDSIGIRSFWSIRDARRWGHWHYVVRLPTYLEATPTVVVMHTITGSPESMREVVRDLNRYTGWRVALCLPPGHADQCLYWKWIFSVQLMIYVSKLPLFKAHFQVQRCLH